MNKLSAQILILALIVSASAFSFSCKREKQEKTTEIMLVNPDEALLSLSRTLTTLNTAEIKKYQDAKIEIGTQDKYEICLNIGARSANALLAIYCGDYQKAEQLSDAIKSSAGKLNIKSGAVETAVKELYQEFKGTDPKKKSRKVNELSNKLRKEIVKALNTMGNKDYAHLIEYGAWIEMMRQVSGIVKSNYAVLASGTLNTKNEIEFFQKSFKEMGKPNEIIKSVVKTTDAIDAGIKLQADKSISKDDVAKINAAASDFCKKYMK